MRISYVTIVLLLSCGSTNQKEITIGVSTRGVAAHPVALDGRGAATTESAEAYVVRLTKAELAVGPVYFCATAAASSSLCQTAVAEVRETFVVDALAPTSANVAELRGITGAIRSAQLDHGVSWFAGQQKPIATRPNLHSLVLEGTLTHLGETRSFATVFDIVSSIAGERSVSGKRLQLELQASSNGLLVTVDPHLWLLGAPVAQWFERGVVDDEGQDLLRQNAAINAPVNFAISP